MALTIGLMSGTSLDGVDGVLADVGGDTLAVRGHAHRAFDPALRAELLALNQSGADELHRAALAANALARVYADATRRLLEQAGCGPGAVAAIGAHGQTVRHRPHAVDGTGYTIQLLSGALLAELAGIDVVCDFRSRDVAAGGHGAPLVPAFHAERFAQPGHDVAVLNLGGIANLTLLPAHGPVRGFDCGPGNGLMDLWCQHHLALPYDDGGHRAARGTVDAAWLAMLLSEPYFALAPPKSTGRDLFNAAWLDARTPAMAPSPDDALATLAELTARAAVDAIDRYAPATLTLLACGGGAFNGHLMERLARLQPGRRVASTAARDVPPDQVEALAFAWLAAAFVERRPGNLTEVTGARGARVLGALYPA